MKQKKSSKPEIRSIKIQPRFRRHKRKHSIVPEIKLSGKWLEQKGFTEGQRVTITTMKGVLVICLDS